MRLDPVSSDVDVVLDRVRTLKRKADSTIHDLLSSVKASKTRRRCKNSVRLEQYKRMIQTYDSISWAGTSLTPRDLVSHGWVSTGRCMVKCESCSVVLSTDLPNITKVDVNVYSKCLRKLRQQLKEAHDITCEHKVKSTTEYNWIGSVDDLNDAMSTQVPDIIAKVKMVIDPELKAVVDAFPQYDSNFVLCIVLNWDPKGNMLNCNLCNRSVLITRNSKFNPLSSHYSWCPTIDKNSNNERKFMNIIRPVEAEVPQTLFSKCMSAKRRMTRALSLVTK